MSGDVIHNDGGEAIDSTNFDAGVAAAILVAVEAGIMPVGFPLRTFIVAGTDADAD